MTKLLFCCFVSLLLVCSSAEEEIGGIGVFVNKKDGLLEKKVPADEAVSDYMGDFIMYNLLQQFHLGEYSFLEPDSIQLGLCARKDPDCQPTFLHYKRPLYPGRDVRDRGMYGFGGVSLIPTTKAHIEQFALIALFDMLVMNSDRTGLPGIGEGNKNNILWHKTKPDVRNSVLLPIDNGWGAVFLILSHNGNARGKSKQEIFNDYKKYAERFVRLVLVIADANKSNMKEITQLAEETWKKNKSIFSKKMEIKVLFRIIPTIVNFWMQNRMSVAEKIKTMTEQQVKDVVNPQLIASQRGLNKEKLAVFKRIVERIQGFRRTVRNSLDLILNSNSAAAYVDQREIYGDDDDAEFEEEIEWLYRKKAKQFQRVLRKAWRKTKNNDLAYSLSDFE